MTTAPNTLSAVVASNDAVARNDIARDRVADRLAALLARTALSGGPFTVFDQTDAAFSLPAPGLSVADLALHDEGDEAFDQAFVPGRASANSGLGPVFDNTSCTGCHAGDGRGRPPVAGERFESMLFRASVPGVGSHGWSGASAGFRWTAAAPRYSRSAAWSDGEHYIPRFNSTLGDGTPYTLRVPAYQFSSPYTSLPASLLVSPRVAPFVFGLGLLENVPDATLIALADPNDRDRDGISGRPNVSWDVALGRSVIGRFGWKATVGTLMQQSAGAYNGDMGITSNLFPAESCEGYRSGCERHALEVSDDIVEATTFYQATLGVPARRALNDATVRMGEDVFYDAGCTSCHTSTLLSVPSGNSQRSRLRGAALIHPYTDLLVHDMGRALADNRTDFLANGNEWRTAPLWGIGLVGVVNGHTNFLHDGRARSLLEAVLWHGGEAEQAREVVRQLPVSSRNALIAFLQSW